MLPNSSTRQKRRQRLKFEEEEMSLRDRFAGMAMQGILSNPEFESLRQDMVTKWAYEIADKMLERRQR